MTILQDNTQDMSDMSITRWQEEVHTLANSKGWYKNVDLDAHRHMAMLAVHTAGDLDLYTEQIRIGGICPKEYTVSCLSGLRHLAPYQHVKLARLWLIASEVFEAIEAVVSNPVYYTSKDGKPEGLGIELADIAIRLLDFCESYQIPLEQYMILKHTYNESRPQRHGGKKV